MFSYQLQTSCQFLAQTDQKLCNLNEVNSNANFYSLRLRLWKRNPTYVPFNHSYHGSIRSKIILFSHLRKNMTPLDYNSQRAVNRLALNPLQLMQRCY